MPVRQEISEGRVPVKVYTGEIEPQARAQLVNISKLPIVHHHVAAMPDVHLGIGATVGSVIPTRQAIIPAAVGVDIGCGMMAARLSLQANQLDEKALTKVFNQISRDVPVGFEQHDERDVRSDAVKPFKRSLSSILEKHPGIQKRVGKNSHWTRQLGSLGGGNHFIEVCVDETEGVWVMLHSGSRGIGNAIGSYFIELAKKDAERNSVQLPDRDLAYFPEGARHFDDYVEALGWAQDYARANREEMLDLVIEAMHRHLPPFEVTREAVNCHHNYVERERHYGEDVWLTRKGAIRARRRARHHPGQHGREELHRARQGRGGELRLLRARRRAADEPQCRAEVLQDRGPGAPDKGRDLPQGPRRDRRDPGRLQGHRRGHGQPVRPGRGGACAQAGPLRERLAMKRRHILGAALLLPLEGLAQTCGVLTPRQTEGPFFKTDTPRRISLIEGKTAQRLVLEGQVLSPQCKPVANALLDFWHADETGDYDNKGFRYRGHQYTDAQGRYRLETIVPAEYPGRTRHIHVKAQAPGRRVLTTQLYFPDDPANARDFLYRPELAMKMPKRGQGTFDFVIDA